MNRSALTAAAGAAGALVLVGALAGGYEIGHGHVVNRTVTVTVTHTATVTASPTMVAKAIARHHARKPRPTASASSTPPSAAAVSFGCKVLQLGGGQEEFNVTTVGDGSYSSAIYVNFYDYAGSGDVFPGTTVQGATPVGAWHMVPSADIGASAEPSGCTATPAG